MPVEPNYSVPSWIHGANPLQALEGGASLGLRIAESNQRAAIAYAEMQRRQQEFQQQMEMAQQQLEKKQAFQQQQFQAEQQITEQNQLRKDQQLQIENAYKQGQLELKRQQLEMTKEAAAGKANAEGKFILTLNTLATGYMGEEGMTEEQARAKAFPIALQESGMFQYMNPSALAGMLKASQTKGTGEFVDIPGGGKGYISPMGHLTVTQREKQTPEPRFSVTPPDPSDPAIGAKVKTISGVLPSQLRQFGVTNVGKYVAPESSVTAKAAAPAAAEQPKRYKYNPKTGKIEAIAAPQESDEEDNANGDSGN